MKKKHRIILAVISALFLHTASCVSPNSNAISRADGEKIKIQVVNGKPYPKIKSKFGYEDLAKFVVKRVFKKLAENTESTSSSSLVTNKQLGNNNQLILITRAYTREKNNKNSYLSLGKLKEYLRNEYKLSQGVVTELCKKNKIDDLISFAALLHVSNHKGVSGFSLVGYSYPVLKAKSYQGLSKLESRKQLLTVKIIPPSNGGTSVTKSFVLNWSAKGDNKKWIRNAGKHSKKQIVEFGDHAFLPYRTRQNKIVVEIKETSKIAKYLEKVKDEALDQVGGD